MALHLVRRHAEPRLRRPGTLAGFDQIPEDRFEHIDRYEHVARQMRFDLGDIAQDQRPDPEQRAVLSDQRGSTPVERRR